MTRRRNPLRTALTAYAVVVVLLMFAALAREVAPLLPLLIVACIWLGWHRARRQTTRPPTRPVTSAADISAEVVRLLAVNDQLAADNERLRADLEDARRSAQLAWDAAAERPSNPKPRPDPDPDLSRLLAAPRSGVRPLFPGGDL